MANKSILILVDGMRPDALPVCGNRYCSEILSTGAVQLPGRSVMPSVTLPCHISLFHSVPPTRHGTLTNTYAQQVRPVKSLFEVLHNAGKTCAMFYNWEQLRDVSRPGSLAYSYMVKGCHEDAPKSAISTYRQSNNMVTDAAIDCLTTKGPDFAFLYLAFSDEAGHKWGWMSPQYFDALENSWHNIDRVLEAVGKEYTVIITADHGGHDRTHGTDAPEDMTIPVIAVGTPFVPGSSLEAVNLKDIAPTVCDLLGTEPDEEWEGQSFL